MKIIPSWPVTTSASDTRKWVALLASFGGAVAFTAFAAALVWIVWRGGWGKGTELARIDILGTALIIVLGGAISANLAFGFVLNRRSFKIGKGGIDISGGDEPPVAAAAQAVAAAATDKAAEITEDAKP